MENIYFADLLFEVLTPIKSLPEYHGARFSAYLRFACRKVNASFNECCIALLPFRKGKKIILEGQHVKLRMILTEEGINRLSNICSALAVTSGKGDFSSESLRLCAIYDGVSGKEIDYREDPENSFTPFTAHSVEDEINALLCYHYFTLNFISPLRLLLPAGKKLKTASKVDKLCKEDFFACDDASLMHVISSVRDLGELDVENFSGCSVPVPWSCETEWTEFKYSRDRQIHLDGVTGTVTFKGKLNSEYLAQRLVMGQYLGIGQDRRFGNGFYFIPELNPARQIRIPKI